MSFTPGPWRVGNWDYVTLAWLKTEEGQADANLIAAAPDLYGALRFLLEHPGDASAVNVARLAIAKAEGRE